MVHVLTALGIMQRMGPDAMQCMNS